MLTGGPVLDYITRLRDNSQVLITGYQIEGSNGQTLLDNGFVTIGKKKVKIDAPATYFDMSAHAGKKDLYEYVKRSGPSKVVCVHGDKENSIALAESLKLEGYDAHAPRIGDTITI